MTQETKGYPDPLIDEVRERRRQIWDECGHDFDKLLEMIQRLQAEHPEKMVDRRKSKRTTPRG